MERKVLHVFRKPALSQGRIQEKLQLLRTAWPYVLDLDCELCFNIEITGNLNEEEEKILWWILQKDYECQVKCEHSFLRSQLKDSSSQLLIEVGPRLNFSTAFSTNAVAICNGAGLQGKVSRVEKSIIYALTLEKSISSHQQNHLATFLYDRMVEQIYPEPLKTFQIHAQPDPWIQVDVLTHGSQALLQADEKLGLAFDQQDIQYYTHLFTNVLKRNPTSVELFDLAQSNSEHSRHWFFKGDIIIDGRKLPKSLIDMIIETQVYSNDNNVIKFEDNSSAIEGFSTLTTLLPANSSQLSLYQLHTDVHRHIIFTAETHNFPTGVAPFQGATTGTGGRIRDVQAAGRGGHVIAGTAGYSFGNLLLSNYHLPWEASDQVYPSNFAKPAQVIIDASNGASDYGNKFGEPVIAGFCRSCGLRQENGERREWIKPIMFSGGIGSIDKHLVRKEAPESGMIVTKVGGPVYRIGVGGGAASSVQVQGDAGSEELNFEAVQRGDPEMEQKLNRLLRACIERTSGNPILSIHDQGAGGNGNVLKEIVEPEGAIIYCDRFTLGDATISTLDLWGAEYQESDAILIAPEDKELLETISRREKCPVDFVGHVTGDGRIRLVENDKETKKQPPVDLDLKHVLGEMPRKKFYFETVKPVLRPLSLPVGATVMQALKRVLRLPSVCSKRFLTNKVDRSVTGLVAQQQCVGPLHTPLADFAMIALTHFDLVGSATSIGEQPMKGLVSDGANARMSVAEAITNIMFAKITCLEDIKCSGNWMWAAKLEGEGAALANTCSAMCNVMKDLGIAVDGGKDSLSMAVRVNEVAKSANDADGCRGSTAVVKSPGTLVVSAYAPVPDIRVKVTPHLTGNGKLIHLDLSGRKGNVRSGGSALAQVFSQVGCDCADLDDPRVLKKTFNLIQQLISSGDVTAGHDVSDGGLLTCVLEMAFASNRGLTLNFTVNEGDDENAIITQLFAEECGIVIEVSNIDLVIEKVRQLEIPYTILGESVIEDIIHVTVSGRTLIKDKMTVLRDDWEETSFQLEKLQTRHSCVEEEQQTLATRKQPKWLLSFDPNSLPLRSLEKPEVLQFNSRPKVAVVREEGINGDREMVASLFMAGFDVLDITTSDLLGQSNFNLDCVRGLIFPGGFSFADVLGSARGWAASLKFNERAARQLTRFKSRPDTFSLGVCNGCQLLALLGWVGRLNEEETTKKTEQDEDKAYTLLDTNVSERFESRFVSVKIDSSPSIMLKGMIGSTLGVWIAHGEGRFTFSDDRILHNLKKNNLIALRYTDDDGHATTAYPMNPNGSVEAIAGLCNDDGRHLAMMPHPERCTQMWQWPYVPSEWTDVRVSPWCSMFTSAYQWCLKN